MSNILDVLLECQTYEEMLIGIKIYAICFPDTAQENIRFAVVEKYDQRFSLRKLNWAKKALQQCKEA